MLLSRQKIGYFPVSRHCCCVIANFIFWVSQYRVEIFQTVFDQADSNLRHCTPICPISEDAKPVEPSRCRLLLSFSKRCDDIFIICSTKCDKNKLNVLIKFRKCSNLMMMVIVCSVIRQSVCSLICSMLTRRTHKYHTYVSHSEVILCNNFLVLSFFSVVVRIPQKCN